MKIFAWTALLTLIGTWLIIPAFGAEYATDFLEPGNPGGGSGSLKTFDASWTLGVGKTFAIDVWAADIPEKIITSGFEMFYDPARLRLVSVEAYDGDATGTQGNPHCCPGLAGLWDPEATSQREDPYGPGSYTLVLLQFSCVAPDAGGDVIIARVTFQGLAAGSSEITFQGIDDFDTTVGCASGIVYDAQMGAHTITISQEGQGSSTTTTSSLSTTTSSISSSTTSTPSSTTSTTTGCLSEKLYGRYAHETILLRNFRDKVLSRTAEGRELVHLYYLWSPAIVIAMERNEEFEDWIKEMIDDALPMIQRIVE